MPMTKIIPNEQTAKLVTPILKDGQELHEILLRKPNSGNLRGLNLINILQMDFDSTMVLIPRISLLNERDMLNMAAENFAPLIVTVAGFFVDTEQ